MALILFLVGWLGFLIGGWFFAQYFDSSRSIQWLGGSIIALVIGTVCFYSIRTIAGEFLVIVAVLFFVFSFLTRAMFSNH